MSTFNTPILLITFRRPETTAKVFEKIRLIKPSKLYLVSDGFRENFQEEKKKILRTRELIKNVDWPCKVKTLFRSKNLGCKKRVSDAINWFFKNEKYGIILEDDCLPHLDFFSFCQNLLNFYYNEKKVLAITGMNYQDGQRRGSASYYFSKYNHCWGWATWRRAWDYYQEDILFWPAWQKSNSWKKLNSNKYEKKYWEQIFDRVYNGKIDSWAYPWTASVWYQDGLTATPNVNLVSNIGFGEDAVHTKDIDNKANNMKTYELKNIKHPTNIKRHLEADEYNFDYNFEGKYLRFPHNLVKLVKRIFLYLKNLIFRNV